MARVHVTSEIGPLRTVLVHTPGRELVAVTPGNREDYLYDDIIDLDLAQREHRRFVAVFGRVAPGYEGRTLLAGVGGGGRERTRLESRHPLISYGVFFFEKKKKISPQNRAHV